MARPRVAAKGARMKSGEVTPPGWAEAILRTLLRPSDRESITGDLLEEYRLVRYPAQGRLRSNVWYVRHVFSVLLHLLLPLLPFAALVGLLQVLHNSPWNYSPIPAPGLSIFHAALDLGAGLFASRRTGLIRTGVIAGAAISFLILLITLTGSATYGVLSRAPFSDPFIFVILSLWILMAVSFGSCAGAIGGVIGRWLGPARSRKVRAS